jgi:hypothetical protein
VPPQRAVDIDQLLQHAGRDQIAAQLAVPAAQIHPDPSYVALEQARADYLYRFHGLSPVSTGRGSRYCPRCLSEDRTWQATWASPLHVVCVTHHVLLANACPNCLTTPFTQPIWLTATGPPWVCPSFYDPLKTHDNGRYRGRCRLDLRSVECPPCDAATTAAQEQLLNLAHAKGQDDQPQQHWCGLPAPAPLALEAILELVHAQVGTHRQLTSVAAWPGPLAQALVNTMLIVNQPTPTAAHATALDRGLLRAQDPQTPIGPTQLIHARAHSRVLETATLLATRGTLSIDSDLTFRQGAALPCYPAQHRHPRDTGHLHPDQALGELPMSSIPTLLWPRLLESAPPTALADTDPVLAGAAAAMALAKTASNRRWNLLATDLGLPARLAQPIRRYWRHLRQDRQTWGAYLAWIDTLLVDLHRTPPPIDYQLRRAVAAEHDYLLYCARDVLQANSFTRPPELGPTALVRAFWPIYTQSDLSLAPPPTPAPDPKADRGVRYLLAQRAVLSPWLQAMNARITVAFPATQGPLTWQPP